jgi:hypothetical protein
VPTEVSLASIESSPCIGVEALAVAILRRRAAVWRPKRMKARLGPSGHTRVRGDGDRDRRPLLPEQHDAGYTAEHQEKEDGLHGSRVASSGLQQPAGEKRTGDPSGRRSAFPSQARPMRPGPATCGKVPGGWRLPSLSPIFSGPWQAAGPCSATFWCDDRAHGTNATYRSRPAHPTLPGHHAHSKSARRKPTSKNPRPVKRNSQFRFRQWHCYRRERRASN